ncbi:Hsp70 family protein [Streptomyces sp. NPDC054847]
MKAFQPKVTAAIDFGTHGSGFGWAVVCEGNDDSATRKVLSVDGWQDQPLSYPKNLTALLLDGDGSVSAWGHAAVRKYNLQRGSNGHRLVNGLDMKMSLKPESADRDRSRTVGGAEKLIVEYLRRLYADAVEHIATKGGFAEEEITWCLTVPAIWDDFARQTMRKAARKAGMPTDEHRFQLCLEPEAAALYARNKLAGGGIDEAGTRLVIVDAGGGTVDITAYEVEQDGRLVELIPPDGDRLGAEYVNTAFREKVLVPRLSSPDRADGCTNLLDLENRVPGLLWHLLQDFERTKVDFDPVQETPSRLPLPTQLYLALDDTERETLASKQDGIAYEFVLSRGEFISLFDQVIDPILKLVKKQLDTVLAGATGPVRLLAVGGFAQSRYFQLRLNELQNDRVKLVIPPAPALAVLYGAVHFAYDPSALRVRRSRYTYGCNISLPFEKGDPESSKDFDDGGKEFCSNRFKTFVLESEPVEVGSAFTHHFTPLRKAQKSVLFNLYRTPERKPRYIDERGSVPIGKLEIKLPPSLRHLPTEDRCIELCMKFGGTEITAAARILATDETLETRVEFEPRW